MKKDWQKVCAGAMDTLLREHTKRFLQSCYRVYVLKEKEQQMGCKKGKKGKGGK